jgi:Zn-dependent peptidase ImmA (M78 family)
VKPDFELAYIKANSVLVTTEAITEFPFSAKKLVEARSDIRCKSYKQAKKYGVDISAFGSESAVLITYHGKKIIFYDDSKPLSHINFSKIHEFGHDDLGHIMSKNISEELYKKQEIETNFYAAQILMPEQLLRYLQHQGVSITVSFLIDNFGVSRQAAEKRIQTLAKTNEEWRSRSEKEFDDIILYKYRPLIQHLCPSDYYDFEEEVDLQRKRESWF